MKKQESQGETSTVDAPAWTNPINREQAEEIKDRAREATVQLKSLIQDHPTAAVFGALAVGFVVGRALRRS